MNINVDLTIVRHLGWNMLAGVGAFAGGCAVATIVDSTARHLLTPRANTPLEHTIKFLSWSAGVAVTAYFAPAAMLVHFTAIQAIKLLVAEAVLVALCTWVDKKEYVPLIAIGVMAGYLGTPGLVALGALGSALGVYAPNALPSRKLVWR